MIEINNLENLEKLARLKITENREKFSSDLKKIIDYFNELKEVNTENVVLEEELKNEFVKNVFQKENVKYEDWFDKNELATQFFEEENNYLKIPPIFE